MKNSSLVVNLVLAAAVAVLYYLHFKSPAKVEPVTEKKEEKQLTQPKIEPKASTVVFVNSDSLLDKYEFVKDTKKVLEQARKNAEANFNVKYKALETEYNQLRDRAATISQDEGMAKQQELMVKEQKLTEYRDQMNESLGKNEMEKNEAVQKNITEYLNRNYNNSNYTYILGYSNGGGILYAKATMDITNEVLEGINNEYRAQKGNKK